MKIGRPLCEHAPIRAIPKTGAVDPLRDEARLFFAALDDDPAAALAALDDVEARARNGEERLRLLALRGQLLLALGEVKRARGVADYLRAAADSAIHRRRIESTTHGHSLLADDADDGIAVLLDQWSSLLNDRVHAIERQALAADQTSNEGGLPTKVRRVRVDRTKPFQIRRVQPGFNKPLPQRR